MKKIILIIITLVTTTFLLSKCVHDELPKGSNVRDFNSTIWKSDSSTNWNNGISIREQMLNDVLENVLPGKYKQEIENILGPSLETGYFQSIDKDLIYYLGPERGNYFNIDSEWLLIWLDKDGKFKRFQILND